MGSSGQKMLTPAVLTRMGEEIVNTERDTPALRITLDDRELAS